MSEPAPHLRVVDEHGEVHEDQCPGCVERQFQLDELTKKYHGTLSQIGKLKKDKDADAAAHKLLPRAKRLFDIYREATGHTKMKWKSDRLWECEPFLRDPDFTDPFIEQAIRGIAYAPHSRTMKNGRQIVYDDWGRHLFKDEYSLRYYYGAAPVADVHEFFHVSVPPDERLAGHYIASDLKDEAR